MIIKVDRVTSDDDSTISIVSVDGHFQCLGLEDEYRAFKKSGETRIPSGKYKVGLRTVGGFHGRYGKKFADIHQGMLQVLDVRGFEYILIHVGNTDNDTAGCLLVGTGCYTEQQNMSIQSSVTAYKLLYAKVINHAKDNDLWIEYVDSDLNDSDG